MKVLITIDDKIMHEEVVNSLAGMEGIRKRVTDLLFKLADRGAISAEFMEESLAEKAAATRKTNDTQ